MATPPNLKQCQDVFYYEVEELLGENHRWKAPEDRPDAHATLYDYEPEDTLE